jgi:hypothetical protein
MPSLAGSRASCITRAFNLRKGDLRLKAWMLLIAIVLAAPNNVLVGSRGAG